MELCCLWDVFEKLSEDQGSQMKQTFEFVEWGASAVDAAPPA